MRIGLWNLEPKIENTAMMQVSMFHKQRGDQVELYSPLFSYDKVYVFSLFSFTKKPVLKKNMVAGGTGFDVKSKLPPEIEACDLDYSIFPKCKTSYIWFSRGCFRKCPFCVVPEKEGFLHAELPKNLNPKATRISVMDNSFTALHDLTFHLAMANLEALKYPVDFQCGIDARLIDIERLERISKLKIYKQIRTAWDNPKDDLSSNLAVLADVFGKSKIMVYVLIGYWSTLEEDLMRVNKIRDLGLDVWVMPYNKKEIRQRAFERWCNRHANCEWPDYSHGEWKPMIVTQKESKGET